MLAFNIGEKLPGGKGLPARYATGASGEVWASKGIDSLKRPSIGRPALTRGMAPTAACVATYRARLRNDAKIT